MIEGLAKPWGELALYFKYASENTIPAEYPSVSLWLFKMANIFGEQYFTLVWYFLVATASLAVVWLVKRLRGNPYVYLAGVLPLGGLFWDRFDVFPALFTILAIYLAKSKYPIFAFNALSVGVLLKVYPIILLPVLVLMMIRDKQYAKLLIGLFVFCLPLAFMNWDFISFHKDRGIQIESIRALPKLLNKESVVEYKHNTFEIK
ncbi:MAG: hypothetical protein PHN39_04265 [Candidatus Pacebacteria bacterium]|nr:hypothetical protein [Candidatus Paceibacterota bacterium]